MNYSITVTFEGEYVFAQLSGQGSYQVSLQVWQEIAQVCQQHGCFNVLGVSEMNHSMTAIQAYEHKEILKEAGITSRYRIAWVEKNPDAREIVEFVETVLTNRGMFVGRVFLETADAEQWLLESPGAE